MEKYIPSKISSSKHTDPWITRDVRRMSKKKQRLYNKAKASQKPSDWKEFKDYRKSTQKKVRQNYWSYQNDMLNNPEDKSNKAFWRFIKSKKQDSTGISSLKQGSKVIFDSKGKATIFNEQFCSVFTSEDTTNLPSFDDPDFPAMNKITVTTDGVLKLLQNLNTKKATGPDLIPARILKDLAVEISPILSCIFQQSLDTGCVPSAWRIANISPIYKKGDRSTASNYRPVSIISICSKIIEHIIFSQIMDHFDNHQVLTDAQHGFRSGRSCETQLLITTNDLAKALDDRGEVDGIVLDFSKAFDRVPHQRLLLKLHHYGVRGPLLTWMENFLTQRSQRVVIDGKSSDWSPVTSGVPQGTVLGPLLFLAFINDLPSGISSKIRLFADDCLLYRTINNSEDTSLLQQDLDRLHQWTIKWQMQFNTDKCHSMKFSLRRNSTTTKYHLGGSFLTSVEDYPYLGLTLSSNMSWTKHINGATARANRILGLVRRNLRGASHKIKEKAYLSLVRPHVEYCSTIWNPHSKKDIARIEHIQRQAARFVLCRYRRQESVTTMLQELQWPSLEDRRRSSSLHLMYKIRHQIVAVNPDLYLTPMAPSSTRSYHPNKYQPIPTRIQLYRYSYFPRTVAWWNTLPGSILSSPSYEVFKGAVAAVKP